MCVWGYFWIGADDQQSWTGLRGPKFSLLLSKSSRSKVTGSSGAGLSGLLRHRPMAFQRKESLRILAGRGRLSQQLLLP